MAKFFAMIDFTLIGHSGGHAFYLLKIASGGRALRGGMLLLHKNK